MEKYMYPAIFTPDEDDGGYTVSFPDLPGCITEGDTAAEAFEMAKDALGGWLACHMNGKKDFPLASAVESLVLEKSEKAMLVEVNSIYLKEVLNKAVRRNVTIPQWLNMAIEKEGINVSAALTKALKKELNL